MTSLASKPTRWKILAQEQGKEKALTRASAIVIILMGIALAYWLWFGLTQRSITDAEGISILAAQGILEHGYPRLPSGFIYYRALFPNYLLAGSIQVFGLNDFSIILPSLVMALGTLWLVYLFARDVLGQPWVGVATAVLLVALQEETYYATSGRMYMSLQFFAMLTSYSAWRGYIKGEARFQWLTILAIAGGILRHQQGGALLVAAPVSVLALRCIKGKDKPSVNRPVAAVALLFLSAVFAIPIIFDEVLGSVAQIASWGGVDPEIAGLNFDVFTWVKHIVQFEFTAPFGLLLGPPGSLRWIRVPQRLPR
jgi:4-amino-4-deoxy-L-arabinose transferase-like glycosyltransferase